MGETAKNSKSWRAELAKSRMLGSQHTKYLALEGTKAARSRSVRGSQRDAFGKLVASLGLLEKQTKTQKLLGFFRPDL